MSNQPPPPPPPGFPAGAPGPAAWQGPPLAEWPQRAIAGAIDFIGPSIVASLVQFFVSFTFGFILSLAAIAWGFYNAYLNGQTGKSFGKQQVGLKVVSEVNGGLIGGTQGIVRYIAHIIDALPCYVGFLFPLFDEKKQTFADKIIKTVVVVDKT